MPERRHPRTPATGRGRHDGEPSITTAPHPHRQRGPAADGRLRAPAPNSTNRTPHHAEIARSATATPRHARHRPASLAPQQDHSQPPGASGRPLPTRRNRQIPIAPKPRSPSGGFLQGGLSDAGPGARHHVDGPHPKPFTKAVIPRRVPSVRISPLAREWHLRGL
jgi:hypothetical protein